MVHNPYLRTSGDSAVRNLLRSSPSIEALSSELHRCKEWSVDTCLEFGKFVVKELPQALPLLATALKQWDDHVVYTVMVQDPCLLENLSHGKTIAATLCLASAWQSLQRLDTWTNNGAPWWIPEYCKAKKLFQWSLQCLIDECCDDQKVAALTILSGLLRYRRASDLSNEDISKLVPHLLKEIQVLSHSVLSPSSSEYTLPIAILSLSVLSSLHRSATPEHDALFQSLHQTLQSTGLVDNLIRFVFDMNAPRWQTTSCNQRHLQSLGLDLFSCWSACDSNAWEMLVANLEPKLEQLLDSFWFERTSDLQFSRVLWLHLYMRSHARFRLNKVLEKMDGNANAAPLLQPLFESLRESSGISYSGRLMLTKILRLLLLDRRCIASHDDLSRTLWQWIDESIVADYFQTVLEHSSVNDIDQPLLLTLVDLLDILLEQSSFGQLERLGAHNLEKLIYLIKPCNVRFDYDVPQQDDDEETPPLHNLSRMDEASICIEHEDVKVPIGYDHQVRLAVATVLARLSSGLATINESTGLLVSRISTVCHDFYADYRVTMDQTVPCRDEIQRFCRFQNCIATPETEDFLATALHASLSLQRQTVLKQQQQQTEMEHKLEMALQEGRKAKEEASRLRQQLTKQSIVFQREMSRIQMKSSQETKLFVSVHASERSKAEAETKRLVQETSDAKAEVTRVRAELQAAHVELETKGSQVDDLNCNIQKLQQLLHDETSKAEETVQVHRANVESLQAKLDSLHNAMEERDDQLLHSEDMKQNLQDNLEDLFADMCSLAQIYQHQEQNQDAVSQQHNEALEELQKKLAYQSKSKQNLEAQLSDIQEENEKLYRKLGKYKERLEQERKGRREDQQKEEEHRRKRNGPVGYLNSLHNSTSTTDNDRSRSSRPPYKTRDRSNYEKENYSKSYESSYRSSTSQRRTKY